MKAIICAAGQGKRLRPYTNEVPKCLVKVSGKRILEYMLDNISSCGIKEAVIVIGYKAEKFRKIMGTRYKGCAIKYYVNKDYDKTDNMYSLWMAKDEIDEGYVFFNADILFNASILKNLIEEPHPDCIVVDGNAKLQATSMKVKVERNKIAEIGRSLKGGNAMAIGIYKYSPEGAKKYFKEIKKIVLKGMDKITVGTPSGQIEKPVQQFIRHSELHAVRTGNLAWQEIDDAEDLKKAAKKLKGILKK